MVTRTPLRAGSLMAWVEPASCAVRVGPPEHCRTVFAGLRPSSYLLAAGSRFVLTSVGSDRALEFRVRDGVPDAVRAVGKPDWFRVVETSLPEPLTIVPHWLEVGLSDGHTDWRCSIPVGRLPALQSGAVRQGLRLLRITRVSVARDDDR